MDRIPYGTPPQWWPPHLNRCVMRVIRPWRRFRVHFLEKLVHQEVRGLENLRQPLEEGKGVMITSKHAGHLDHMIFLTAGEQLGVPFYYMAGWQVFQLLKPHERWVLQRHGCFSVDRESTDMKAFRLAVEILQKSNHPLVMFPEGEIYHHNEWVFPFRAGTATIALTAARRAQRPICCVPAAIKYEYVQDPTPQLLELMEKLEQRIGWQPRPALSLNERIFTFAEGWISLKERKYLGQVQPGRLPDRILPLAEAVLRQVEDRQGLHPDEGNIPERVTPLRQHAIQKRESLPPGDPQIEEPNRDLEDLDFVIQLFSYSQDFYSDDWNLERRAEILDKLEEDVLEAPTASLRGTRRSLIAFGKPIDVPSQKTRNKDEARFLTETLEHAVQAVVEEIYESTGSKRTSAVPAQA